MRDQIVKVDNYFRQFSYIPDFEEYFTFFPIKIDKKRLKSHLDRTKKNTREGYTKSDFTIRKLQKVILYLRLLSLFSCFRLVALSGSASMLSASRQDDLDFFIISERNRMWTARFASNILALLSGVKRRRNQKHAQNKVCLNLFFDGSELTVPKSKRNEYTAHEVLQTIPLLVVNDTYKRFLKANMWVNTYFPNAELKSYTPSHALKLKKFVSVKKADSETSLLGDLLEWLLKKIQLFYMKKPEGDELILENQLWFHPLDYANKIKRRRV